MPDRRAPTTSGGPDRSGVVEELLGALGAERVTSDPDIVASLSHDQASWAPRATALAVVRPRTANEVVTTVTTCARHQTPVVPRGAGTGLSGGANASTGSVVVSLEKMDHITLIDPVERLAVVGPGVINDRLREAAAQHGLWYPPDPASSPWSTIGGNVATNAGGLCCTKYGVTGDYVLALEVVTGNGDLVHLGRRTAKGVAGYDLTKLMVGSEGTLGIITEVVVRLRPAPPPPHTVVGFFPGLVAAGTAIEAAAEDGITPSMLELVDELGLAAVDQWKNMGLGAMGGVVLMGRTDEPGEEGERQARRLLDCFRRSGATDAEMSSDPAEGEAMFAARRLVYPALERLGPVMTEDVCVPKRHVVEMLRRVGDIGAQFDVPVAAIAHAGDGNLHPFLVLAHDDDELTTRAKAAFHAIIGAALELGGTVTGEHGIGLLKRDALVRELQPAVLEMHRSLKRALDPAGLMNPGKVFAGAEGPGEPGSPPLR